MKREGKNTHTRARSRVDRQKEARENSCPLVVFSTYRKQTVRRTKWKPLVAGKGRAPCSTLRAQTRFWVSRAANTRVCLSFSRWCSSSSSWGLISASIRGRSAITPGNSENFLVSRLLASTCRHLALEKLIWRDLNSGIFQFLPDARPPRFFPFVFHHFVIGYHALSVFLQAFVFEIFMKSSDCLMPKRFFFLCKKIEKKSFEKEISTKISFLKVFLWKFLIFLAKRGLKSISLGRELQRTMTSEIIKPRLQR